MRQGWYHVHQLVDGCTYTLVTVEPLHIKTAILSSGNTPSFGLLEFKEECIWLLCTMYMVKQLLHTLFSERRRIRS